MTKPSLITVFKTFVYVVSLLVAAIYIISNWHHEKTLELMFILPTLTVISHIIVKNVHYFDEKTGRDKLNSIVLKKLLLIVGLIVMTLAIVLLLSFKKQSFQKDLRVDLYFGLDNYGFFNTMFRVDEHEANFETYSVLLKMTEFLNDHPNWKIYIDNFKVRKSSGLTIRDYMHDESKVRVLLRDFGEYLMFNGIRSFNPTRTRIRLQHGISHKALPPKSIISQNKMNFSVLFSSNLNNVFTPYVDGTIILPKDFITKGLTRTRDGVSEIKFTKKFLNHFDVFTLKIRIYGPEFIGGRGPGLIPKWIGISTSEYTMHVGYKLEIYAESKKYFAGYKNINEYFEWVDNLWDAITFRLGWTQMSDEMKFLFQEHGKGRL